MVEAGSVPQMLASDSDHKFTVLPFTPASGAAVCCVVIFQSNSHSGKVSIQWRMGIDRTIHPIQNNDGEIDVEKNIGCRKFRFKM